MCHYSAIILVIASAVPAFGSSCAATMNDTGLGGTNIKGASYYDPTLNITRCCQTCDATPGCSGWTLNPNSKLNCYIKDSVAKKKEVGCLSGLGKVTPAPPTPPPSPLPTPSPVPCKGRCPNILFLIADDMRPQLGCYGHDWMHTPHLDKLAATGVLFNRAYVQYAFCAPSRNSFMTGRRPDRSQVWNFIDNFRSNGQGADWTTLPQNFKENGYFVAGTGKTFHSGSPPQEDYPYSWSTAEMPYGWGGSASPGHPERNTTDGMVICDNRTMEVLDASSQSYCTHTVVVLHYILYSYHTHAILMPYSYHTHSALTDYRGALPLFVSREVTTGAP
jgi:hypothetical protein